MPSKETNLLFREAYREIKEGIAWSKNEVRTITYTRIPKKKYEKALFEKIEAYFLLKKQKKQRLLKQTLYEYDPTPHPLNYPDLYVLHALCRTFGVLMVNDKIIENDRAIKTYLLVGFEYDVRLVIGFWGSYTSKKLKYLKTFKKRLALYKRYAKNPIKGLSSDSLEKVEQFKENRSIFLRIFASIYIEFCFEILDKCPTSTKLAHRFAELTTRIDRAQYVKLHYKKYADPTWFNAIGKKYRQVYHYKLKNPFQHERTYFQGGPRKLSVFDYLPQKLPRPVKGYKPFHRKSRVSKAVEYLRKIKDPNYQD